MTTEEDLLEEMQALAEEGNQEAIDWLETYQMLEEELEDQTNNDRQQ